MAVHGIILIERRSGANTVARLREEPRQGGKHADRGISKHAAGRGLIDLYVCRTRLRCFRRHLEIDLIKPHQPRREACEKNGRGLRCDGD